MLTGSRDELGIRRTTAEVLIRRGHATADAARAFLDQDGPAHDPMLLGDMAAACERIERAIVGRRARSASTATTTPTASAPPRLP